MTPDGAHEDLAPYDLLYIPGGFGTRLLMDDTRFIEHLKTSGRDRPLASVYSGALLLGRPPTSRAMAQPPISTHSSATGCFRLERSTAAIPPSE